MTEDVRLYLISANKSRPPSNIRWKDDDYDVRHGAPDGPVAGRIYRVVHSPSDKPWLWAVQLFPAVAADTGTAETRESAMAAFKAQWIARAAPAVVPAAWAAGQIESEPFNAPPHRAQA